MKNAFAVVIVILLCLSSFSAFAQTADTEIIKKFIATQATKERGEEYEDARKIIAGDLNRDGEADVAVLYTIEGQDGTNNYLQYLAVFVRKNGALIPTAHTVVGGKNYRSVELQSVDNGVIRLTTLGYAKNDPSCCPTRKGSARYSLVNGKLSAMRNQVKK